MAPSTFQVAFLHIAKERDMQFNVECHAVPRIGESIYLSDEAIRFVVKDVAYKLIEHDGHLIQAVNVLVGDP